LSIDLDTWRRRLELTLADGRASRGERAALRELAIDADLSTSDRRQLRALVFEVARASDSLATGLEWAEDALRALEPVEEETGPPVVAFSPGDEPRELLSARMDACRRRLDIAVFTITDDRLTGAIVRAAERGVRVRIIGDDAKAHDLGSDMLRLLEHRLIEVALDDEGHMHHKFAIFDGVAVATGSFNWTRSASHANHENVLISEVLTTVEAYQTEFEDLFRIYRR
jgi:mitochondrial cardiolipin hydrolase